MSINKINHIINHKINEYYLSVGMIANNPAYEWDFDPIISLYGSKFDIIQNIEKINEFLYISGYNFELEILYVNRFCLNEHNLRFLYGEKIREITISNEDAYIFDFSEGSKPDNFKHHLIFSVNPDSFYNEKKYKRLVIDYGLLKQQNIDPKTFSDALLFLTELKEISFHNASILTFANILDEILKLDYKLKNILSLALCKTPSRKIRQLLVRYKTQIGLPYVFNNVMAKEFILAKNDTGGTLELIKEFKKRCDQWYVYEYLMDEKERINFKDIQLTAEKSWLLQSQQEYSNAYTFFEKTALLKFNEKYQGEINQIREQVNMLIQDLRYQGTEKTSFVF